MRDPSEHRLKSPDLTFIVWAAIVAIAFIVAAYAVAVSPGVDPDRIMSILSAP